MAKFWQTIFMLALGLPLLAAAFPGEVEARQNAAKRPPRPTTFPTASTCPGTRLSCDSGPGSTSYVTSGSAVITTVITTYFSVPVTLPTTISVPGSCFSYLVPTLQSNNEFCGPWTSKCGPTRGCTVTSTVTGPCRDPCCTCTPVVYTAGACRTTCDKCATTWKTVPQTAFCSQ